MYIECFISSLAGFLRWFWLNIQVDAMRGDVGIFMLIEGRDQQQKIIKFVVTIILHLTSPLSLFLKLLPIDGQFEQNLCIHINYAF